jgi:hypothetical protein
VLRHALRSLVSSAGAEDNPFLVQASIYLKEGRPLPDNKNMSTIDIQLPGHNGNAYSAFRALDEEAGYAPACVFGEHPDEWVPVAIAYAYALISNGAEAERHIIDEASSVIVNTTDTGSGLDEVLAVITSTDEGAKLLADYDL